MFLAPWKITQLVLDTAKRVLKAQLRGPGQEGADDDAASYDDAECFFPMGLIGYADTATNGGTLEALCLEYGDEVVPLAIVNKSMAAFSPAVEAGETRLYGAKTQAAMVRLRANGETDVLADAANSKVVSLGDASTSTKFLIGDQEALRTWCSNVTTMINDLKAQFNALRTSYTTVTATANLTSGNVAFSPGAASPTTTASAISEADIATPPALSSKVKAI